MLLSDFQDWLISIGGMRFERFVLNLIAGSGRFQRIQENPVIEGHQVDIEAWDISEIAGAEARWLFEIKHRPTIPKDVMQHIALVGRIAVLSGIGHTHFVLVIPGRLTAAASESARTSHIEVWDAAVLFKLATPEILSKYLGETSPVVDAPTLEENKGEALSESLRSLPTGRPHAEAYQRLSSEVLEFLFCPPLEAPRYEMPDAARRNRRDMIFENATIDGWWAFLRETYSAHYVVVDAKNYTLPLKKQPVLDIAHYLKAYGCGLFGMLVSRKGPGDAARHAIGEQWIGDKKMIVVLSDDDILEMLRMKVEGGRPEEVIRGRIAEFRMRL
jgi:hypothetical protein